MVQGKEKLYIFFYHLPVYYFQVTGELSNDGQPMRRFMQTFVLAPQSPKKYYVHNDIFRYQDEVFSDEEGDDERACNVGQCILCELNFALL